MSKYEPLGQFLGRLDAEHWRPTFHELERMLEFELPAGARKRPAWWANEGGPKSQARAWLDAGWSVEKVDLDKGVVSFVKGQAAPPAVAGEGSEPQAGPAAVAARVADQAKARAQAAKDWATEVPGRAADMVRTRPAVVLAAGAGVAFVAGVVLGLLLVPRAPSARERAEELAEEHADDFFHMLKGKLSGLSFPTRAAAAPVQSRAEDALQALKDGLKNIHLPNQAAEMAREKAEDAIHLLRDRLKDLRTAAMERFGR